MTVLLYLNYMPLVNNVQQPGWASSAFVAAGFRPVIKLPSQTECLHNRFSSCLSRAGQGATADRLEGGIISFMKVYHCLKEIQL